MPNTQILLPVEGEAEDTPKKFRNIDREPYEFTWDGKPFGGIFPDRMKIEQEIVDLPNGKTDVVKHYFFTKPIYSNELVIMPKYLVNYAAMHLARKMYKRKMYEGKTEAERSVGIVKIVNAEEEMKLQKLMVQDNFTGDSPEEVRIPNETPPPSTTANIPPAMPNPSIEEPKPVKKPFKCEICGQEFSIKLALMGHMRKHNKPKSSLTTPKT